MARKRGARKKVVRKSAGRLTDQYSGAKSCLIMVPSTADRSMQKVHQLAILPAAEAAGFDCVLFDEIPKGGVSLKDIVRAANKADVVIANITGCYPDVMYVLGLAHGLLKPVITLAQDNTDAPLDLKVYGTIEYGAERIGKCETLRGRIVEALMATDLESPSKSNPVIRFLPHVLDHNSIEHVKRQNAELEEKNTHLDRENSKLKAVAELSESIVQNLGAYQYMEELLQSDASHPNDSVTLSVANETRTRVKFNRVRTDKRRSIPPRNR